MEKRKRVATKQGERLLGEIADSIIATELRTEIPNIGLVGQHLQTHPDLPLPQDYLTVLLGWLEKKHDVKASHPLFRSPTLSLFIAHVQRLEKQGMPIAQAVAIAKRDIGAGNDLDNLKREYRRNRGAGMTDEAKAAMDCAKAILDDDLPLFRKAYQKLGGHN